MSTNILVIDDNLTSRAKLRACLPTDMDYAFFEADDLGSALAVTENNQFDICFVDYNMPNTTGLEIAKILIDNGFQCKFILMTANTQQAVLNEAKQLGITDQLDKPVTPERVIEVLKGISK